MPTANLAQQAADYKRIEQAIKFLQSNYSRQPELREIARSVHLSEFHFQRLFTRWAGISPKKFLQYLTIDHAKTVLKQSRSLLDATYESGLSSPGRLHDLFITLEAMTPGEFKNDAGGLAISYGFHLTPFGECLLAVTDRGICSLSFIERSKRREILEDLKSRWPNARFQEDEHATRPFVEKIFSSPQRFRRNSVPLLVRGTNFQVKVWEALLNIPRGFVLSYEDVAAMIGKPTAARAVGNAAGANPVAFLIPCHRVIQSAGIAGNYRWGSTRKQALLAWEASQTGRTKAAPVTGGR